MPSRTSGSTARVAHTCSMVRTGSRPGSTQAHLRPSGLFLRNVLIHSDVTDFGRCQEQIGKGQKERRQIAGGGGQPWSSHRRTRKCANGALCMCQLAEASQPSGPECGVGQRRAPRAASPARGPRRAARARPRRGRRRRGPCSSRTARGRSACARGGRVGEAPGAARPLQLAAVRCAGRGVPGVVCQVRLARWRAGREETASRRRRRGMGRVTSPRGRGESDCAPQHASRCEQPCACGAQAAACMRRARGVGRT